MCICLTLPIFLQDLCVVTCEERIIDIPDEMFNILTDLPTLGSPV